MNRYKKLVSNTGIFAIGTFSSTTKLKVISAYEMNNDNPKDSYILLKKVGVDAGKVLNTASLPKIQITDLLSTHRVNENMVLSFSSCLYKAMEITKQWLKATGSEFVLDPEFYHII